jgi:hypothetical protein
MVCMTPKPALPSMMVFKLLTVLHTHILEIKPRASHMLGKCSNSELYLQPQLCLLINKTRFKVIPEIMSLSQAFRCPLQGELSRAPSLHKA